MFNLSILISLLVLLHFTDGAVVQLDVGDIKEIIGNSEDAWIVCLDDDNKDITTLEQNNRGLFKVGKMKKKEYKAEKEEPGENLFVIFPYGIEAKKRLKLSYMKSLKKAVKSVLQNIPDHTTTLPNTLDTQNEKLRGFFQEAYIRNPTRFPVVYFTDTLETPVELKQLALKYSTLFYFGVIHKPDLDTQRSYAISNLPHITAFVVDEIKNIKPRIRKIPYVQQFYGPIKYSYLVRFLYLLHQNHFRDLPLSDVNKNEIDLDAVFIDEIQLFRDDYLRFPINTPKPKSEL